MRPLPLLLACAIALGSAGCVIKQGKLRPGLFVNPNNSRDPDPTRNFAAPPEENPSAPEGGRAPSRGGSTSEIVQTATATLAVIAAGVMPSLIWTSTFDENSWFEPKPADPPATDR
jgi:hypothetical protein